jgi:hypothetical protein
MTSIVARELLPLSDQSSTCAPTPRWAVAACADGGDRVPARPARLLVGAAATPPPKTETKRQQLPVQSRKIHCIALPRTRSAPGSLIRRYSAEIASKPEACVSDVTRVWPRLIRWLPWSCRTWTTPRSNCGRMTRWPSPGRTRGTTVCRPAGSTSALLPQRSNTSSGSCRKGGMKQHQSGQARCAGRLGV